MIAVEHQLYSDMLNQMYSEYKKGVIPQAAPSVPQSAPSVTQGVLGLDTKVGEMQMVDKTQDNASPSDFFGSPSSPVEKLKVEIPADQFVPQKSWWEPFTSASNGKGRDPKEGDNENLGKYKDYDQKLFEANKSGNFTNAVYDGLEAPSSGQFREVPCSATETLLAKTQELFQLLMKDASKLNALDQNVKDFSVANFVTMAGNGDDAEKARIYYCELLTKAINTLKN